MLGKRGGPVSISDCVVDLIANEPNFLKWIVTTPMWAGCFDQYLPQPLLEQWNSSRVVTEVNLEVIGANRPIHALAQLGHEFDQLIGLTGTKRYHA
jgi:hypothetical protein